MNETVKTILCVVTIGLFMLCTHSEIFSSIGSSHGFSNNKDVLEVIDGKTVSTPLGSIHFSDGQAYSGGEWFCGVVVKSVSSSKAVISISSPYGGGSLYEWEVTPSGNITRRY